MTCPVEAPKGRLGGRVAPRPRGRAWHEILHDQGGAPRAVIGPDARADAGHDPQAQLPARAPFIGKPIQGKLWTLSMKPSHRAGLLHFRND
jgi:hypothetical protein